MLMEQGVCTGCDEGYFLALALSGTYCENNNNMDSYFLYIENLFFL